MKRFDGVQELAETEQAKESKCARTRIQQREVDEEGGLAGGVKQEAMI